MTPEPAPPISAVLHDLASGPDERIEVGRILEAFGERALGALAFVFAAPLALPMPPGVSAVLGAPLLFVAAQMLLGRPRLWLPRSVSARSLSRSQFQAVEARARPILRRIERSLRPRLTFLFTPTSERLTGAAALALAVIVFLPIPFGNMLPAFSIAAMGLGLLERDGLLLVTGWLAAGGSVVILALMWHWAVAAVTALAGAVSGLF